MRYLLSFVLLVFFGAPIAAADLDGQGPLVVDLSANVERYARMRATVHVIRAAFEVEEPAEAPLISQEIRQALADGLSEAELRDAEIDLLAEGSYFLVAMEYLVLSGFPAWPEDRPPAAYRRDALAILGPLRAKLVSAVLDGSDPTPVFDSAAMVYWWTEGAKAPVSGRADFSIVQSVVAQVN